MTAASHAAGPRFGGPPITTREEIATQRMGVDAHQFALAAAEMAANTRCENVILLDLRGKSPVTEYFVIATGTSPRQMRTAIDEIRDLGKKSGFTAWRQDGYESARWIVLDCVNVVIHVFDSDSRDFYDLELLWGDSPRVNWRQELGLPAELEKPAPVADDAEEEPDEYNDDDEAAPVEVELPDESTGSNSVEFVEVDPPARRGRGNRFPVVVQEEEDTTAEERTMGPMSEAADTSSIDEDDESAPVRSASPRKPAARKAVAKKSAAKKPAPKKPAARKPAARKPASKKAPAKKKPARKAAPKKPLLKKKPRPRP